MRELSQQRHLRCNATPASYPNASSSTEVAPPTSKYILRIRGEKGTPTRFTSKSIFSRKPKIKKRHKPAVPSTWHQYPNKHQIRDFDNLQSTGIAKIIPLKLVFSGILFFFLFFEKGYLCIPGSPGTHFVDESGLEPTMICMPLPSKCWGIKDVHHHCLV